MEKNMPDNTDNPAIASHLFKATMIVTFFGIFISVYFLFTDDVLAYRIAAAVLVGIVGIISFVRHSIFYRSDQARMGWRQEHPEFQLEVGYANLAIGITALLAALLNLGSRACGITLLVYGIYLFCTLMLHVHEMLSAKEHRERRMKSVINTGVFVFVLLIFAFLALSSSLPAAR